MINLSKECKASCPAQTFQAIEGMKVGILMGLFACRAAGASLLSSVAEPLTCHINLALSFFGHGGGLWIGGEICI